MSHHSTEDIGAMKVLPNITIFSPCDPIETKAVNKAAIELKAICYIRLGRGGEPNIHKVDFSDFEIGKAYRLSKGNDGCIFSTGIITIEALKAVEKLKEININVELNSFSTIKPIDVELVKKCS